MLLLKYDAAPIVYSSRFSFEKSEVTYYSLVWLTCFLID